MRKYPGRTPGGGRRGREGCGRDVSRGCTPVGQWKNSGSSSAGTRSSECGWSHTVLSCTPRNLERGGGGQQATRPREGHTSRARNGVRLKRTYLPGGDIAEVQPVSKTIHLRRAVGPPLLPGEPPSRRINLPRLGTQTKVSLSPALLHSLRQSLTKMLRPFAREAWVLPWA